MFYKKEREKLFDKSKPTMKQSYRNKNTSTFSINTFIFLIYLKYYSCLININVIFNLE